MEGALLFKLLLAGGGFAVWAYRQLKAKAEQPAPSVMTAPPPIPRRVRRPRSAAKPAPAPAPEPAAAPVRPEPVARPVVAERTPVRPDRAQFRGAAALRRAIVAREVLGPPLCLRPPRS
ncbi:MAG: hypothetical protein FJ384_03335 [Verrucomicrobia bacterium]|nr:hypothetical protein [Verrucomicrobiota bacterium]